MNESSSEKKDQLVWTAPEVTVISAADGTLSGADAITESSSGYLSS